MAFPEDLGVRRGRRQTLATRGALHRGPRRMVRRLVQAPGPVLEPLSSAVQAPADSAMVVGLGSAVRAELLADLAVRVLVEEAELTPKPALVDRRGGGAHQDMNLEMFRRSAHALRPTSEALATRAHLCEPEQTTTRGVGRYRSAWREGHVRRHRWR